MAQTPNREGQVVQQASVKGTPAERVSVDEKVIVTEAANTERPVQDFSSAPSGFTATSVKSAELPSVEDTLGNIVKVEAVKDFWHDNKLHERGNVAFIPAEAAEYHIHQGSAKQV